METFMGRKGLSRDKIVETAVRLIEENGVEGFSLHSLARELGIKTASLYNHIENIGDVYTEAGLYALKDMESCLREASGSKVRDDAIRSIMYAYLGYAHEHTELYDLIMYVRSHGYVGIEQFSDGKSTPIIKALSTYRISMEELVHFHRLLRSILHGFITHERIGFFTYREESLRRSYEVAIDCFLSGIHKTEQEEELE